jgi:preprotein translocase subunit SecD
VLTDPRHTVCYVLGATRLRADDVERARTVVNPASSEWEVSVRFANDDFVREVASVEVGEQVAIVADGVFESAPIVNVGITGRDVTIAGTAT